MDQQEPQFLEVGQGPKRRRIAYRWTEAQGEGDCVVLVWLSGFLSDMSGTKAQAMADWARANGRSMLRFDYSGHGQSDGNLLEASIGDWLEEAAAALRLIGGRRALLIGSSMGGWMALLLARALAQSGKDQVAGLVLIAPAWDMTERLMWREMPPEVRARVETEGVYYAPSLYGDAYPITRHLIEEGRAHLLGTDMVDVRPSIRILQGMRDPDVPWGHALDLVDLLCCDDVELTLIKDGDHRHSRPQDLRRLEATVAALIEKIESEE
jgi:pimeloyl-ACP methyl ester carboxylesterase